ncbi:hypothetical protein CSA80_03715 [Candidatus Saccharibacteria bacterium]|nr:MAG: hypothetical protein CR973_01205 [Candidatus Saccharibacteria bacterium]PID99193.1 MAG: hypothetical protein CSA80_03715 [Candidatus Saccharibacteria bacterium]
MIGQWLFQRVAQIDLNPLPNSSNKAADPAQNAVGDVLQIVFGVAASIAVLIIVISGFRYIVSAGDPNKMAQAKKSILYAVLGLLVSLAAFSIVTLVVKRVG